MKLIYFIDINIFSHPKSNRNISNIYTVITTIKYIKHLNVTIILTILHPVLSPE